MDPNERSPHGKFGPLKNSLLQTPTSRSPSVTSRLLAAGVVEASNAHFAVTEAVLQFEYRNSRLSLRSGAGDSVEFQPSHAPEILPSLKGRCHGRRELHPFRPTAA